jgi:hypothetical protein
MEMSNMQTTPPDQIRTPAATRARLAAMPAGDLPSGFVLLGDDDDYANQPTIGMVKSGDFIAIDRLWFKIKTCTEMNKWITVQTPPGGPCITAYQNNPVYLARQCCIPGESYKGEAAGGVLSCP